MAGRNFSIVEYFGADDGHSCGYCKNEFNSFSDGMWAHSLSVEDYQDLIDRGWRRSGLYCYKPIMDKTCCPQYTIKCAAVDFQISKSQKKVIKKMNKFLAEGLQQSDKIPSTPEEADQTCVEMPDLSERAQASLKSVEPVVQTEQTYKKNSAKKVKMITQGKASTSENTSQIGVKTEAIANLKVPTKAPGESESHPPCRKAKLIRKERWMEKMKKKGIDPASVVRKPAPPPVSLEELLAPPENSKHHLELRLVQSCPPSEEFIRTQEQSLQVYRKYQVTIHDDPPEKVTMKQFLRFLINSPLDSEENSNGVKYGSFHHQYWLDGKLIAVGVVDILPSCVSSVYFFYDPEYSYLSLGTYAALREVALTRELQKKAPQLQFYYLGFYIHSCPKMKYKGQYTPSLLLCPVNYTWHKLESCRAKLDAKNYCVFSDQGITQNDINIDEVLVLYRRTAMPFKIYEDRNTMVTKKEKDEVKRYTKLVGHECTTRMLLVRS